ncbi:response regulator [Fictibacillus sp. Mic-4]|uniref:ANTAR domain-containing response regulator n=1 Tax=Fictibacillus TaxID=1329200 RepID=UPI00040C59A1|nr:response regulator [Fictibacillus gelatini]
MSKPRIMVVDDESILRMDLKEMLTEAGYDVVAEANTGELAIELAALNQPDLIIMDVKMPKMNGLKASKIIDKAYHIPILLLTAYSESEFIEQSKNAGVIGYLVKPITEKQLIPAVEIALAQTKRMNDLRGNIKNLEQKIEDRKVIEKAKGILIDQYNLTEEEAYKKLRAYCMNHRLVMKDVANYVIKHKQLDFSARISC